MDCIFPVIKEAIDRGQLSPKSIANILEIDEENVLLKLCGRESFDVNEAMTINKRFFPEVPFKKLYTPFL